MVAVTTTKRKASGTYQRAWYYCPAAHTKGPTVCTHTKRYRKDVLELWLENRAVKAMKRKNLAALAAVINEALRRHAARTTGREDELRAELARAEAERERR